MIGQFHIIAQFLSEIVEMEGSKALSRGSCLSLKMQVGLFVCCTPVRQMYTICQITNVDAMLGKFVFADL